MKDYKDLVVWQKAHALTLEVYRCSAKFPREELFSLTKQVRRCSSSVGANIAEGVGRRCEGDLDRFLTIAAGSQDELDYHLLLAKDLGYLAVDQHRTLLRALTEVRMILSALLAKVRRGRAASRT